MSEITFHGVAGRLQGDYYRRKAFAHQPLALLLPPHPQLGGTMHTPIIKHLFDLCVYNGFATLRFNFRGAGRSEGVYDNGGGEINDAATALDWLQKNHPDPEQCWIIGYSFGAWIGMQLLMRRPEISHFISIAPPVNLYDFSFLTPCPASGLILQGSEDRVALPNASLDLSKKLKSQKDIQVIYKEIQGANHVFKNKKDEMIEVVNDYMRDYVNIFAKTRDEYHDKLTEKRTHSRARQKQMNGVSPSKTAL